jgi:hypothetical protein
VSDGDVDGWSPCFRSRSVPQGRKLKCGYKRKYSTHTCPFAIVDARHFKGVAPLSASKKTNAETKAQSDSSITITFAAIRGPSYSQTGYRARVPRSCCPAAPILGTSSCPKKLPTLATSLCLQPQYPIKRTSTSCNSNQLCAPYLAFIPSTDKELRAQGQAKPTARPPSKVDPGTPAPCRLHATKPCHPARARPSGTRWRR